MKDPTITTASLVTIALTSMSKLTDANNSILTRGHITKLDAIAITEVAQAIACATTGLAQRLDHSTPHQLTLEWKR